MVKFAPFEVVFLCADLPENGLTAGQMGTVLEVCTSAYEVEFCDGEGKTIALLYLAADQICH